jgi:hypothetical protein
MGWKSRTIAWASAKRSSMRLCRPAGIPPPSRPPLLPEGATSMRMSDSACPVPMPISLPLGSRRTRTMALTCRRIS